jgi:hypothetical protein
MWQRLLTGLGEKSATASMLISGSDKEHPLRFKPPQPLALERGVPDDMWRSSEIVPFEDDTQGRLPL